MVNAGTKDWAAVIDERFSKMEAELIKIRNEFKDMMDNDFKQKKEAIALFTKACNLVDAGEEEMVMESTEAEENKQQPEPREGGAVPAEPERKVDARIGKSKKKPDVRIYWQRSPALKEVGRKAYLRMRNDVIQATVRKEAGRHRKMMMEGRKEIAVNRRSKGTIKKERHSEYFKRRKKEG